MKKSQRNRTNRTQHRLIWPLAVFLSNIIWFFSCSVCCMLCAYVRLFFLKRISFIALTQKSVVRPNFINTISKTQNLLRHHSFLISIRSATTTTTQICSKWCVVTYGPTDKKLPGPFFFRSLRELLYYFICFACAVPIELSQFHVMPHLCIHQPD